MPPTHHISKTDGPTRTKQFAKLPLELQSHTWELTSNSTSISSSLSGLRASDIEEVEEEQQEANSGTEADQVTDSTIGSKEPVRMRGGLASAAAIQSAPRTGAMRKRSRDGDDSDDDSGHYPSESEDSDDDGDKEEEEEKNKSFSEGGLSTSTSPRSSSPTIICSTSEDDAARDPSDDVETEQTPFKLRSGQLASAVASSTSKSRYHNNDADESEGDASEDKLQSTTNGPVMLSTAQKKPGPADPIGAIDATNNTASHRRKRPCCHSLSCHPTKDNLSV